MPIKLFSKSKYHFYERIAWYCAMDKVIKKIQFFFSKKGKLNQLIY